MPGVTNAATHAMVARCLLEPGFLDLLARDSFAESEDSCFDAETRAVIAQLDIAKVRWFGGFISKVQHNDLWDDFPSTRALLRYYGAELATFADYRVEYLRLASEGKPSRATKTVAFLDYLDSRFRGQDGYPGLLDVLTHERLHWEVAQSVLASPPRNRGVPTCEPVGLENDGRMVVPRDCVRVAVLNHDPQEVAARLREGGAGMAGLAPRTVCLCYWGCKDAESVSVLAVDPPTAAVLAAVGEGRTVCEVLDYGRTLLPEAGRGGLARILDAVVRRGLVELVDVSAEVG